MPSHETLEIIVSIGFVVFLISYAIAYRLERNYYKKNRQELTQLLYGHDPFESEKKLYWSDQFIMSVGTFFGLHMAWRHKKNMRVSKEGLLIFAPNIMENENYNTLSKNHPYLKKLFLADLVIGIIFFTSGGIAFFIKP